MSYTKGTWVDDDGSGTTGTPVTKARMDKIEQGVYDVHYPLHCEVALGVNQPLLTAAFTVINFDLELDDPAGMHAPNSPHIILPEAGLWCLEGQVEIQDPYPTATDGIRLAQIRYGPAGNVTSVAATQVAAPSRTGMLDMYLNLSRTMRLPANTNVNLVGVQQNGQTWNALPNNTWLTVTKVGN